MAALMSEPDVPSPVDLCNPIDALEWEAAAQLRPGRAEMLQTFVTQLQAIEGASLRVLELGSGPGFLASLLLDTLPDIELTLLDFSAAMHELARARLGQRSDRVHYVHRSFKDKDWTRGLGTFDAIITNQAVHELRHKQHAVTLHAQVAMLLKPGSPYLVCDHFQGDGGMKNNQLFMSVEEQRQALLRVGFRSVERVNMVGSLVMHRAV